MSVALADAETERLQKRVAKYGERAMRAQVRLDALQIAKAKAAEIDVRLVYAARERCVCGHGLAFDPAGASGFKRFWGCSAAILGIADPHFEHAERPFAFHTIEPEHKRTTTRKPK